MSGDREVRRWAAAGVFFISGLTALIISATNGWYGAVALLFMFLSGVVLVAKE